MMNVCHGCGEYRAGKEIDPAGPYAVCPLCGFKHRFRMLPLVMIDGAVPENVEACVERRYFSTVHYLALTCDDETIAARLRARPAWRACGSAEYIDGHVTFNRWFREKAISLDPPVELLDTTGLSVAETGRRVAQWIEDRRTRDGQTQR